MSLVLDETDLVLTDTGGAVHRFARGAGRDQVDLLVLLELEELDGEVDLRGSDQALVVADRDRRALAVLAWDDRWDVEEVEAFADANDLAFDALSTWSYEPRDQRGPARIRARVDTGRTLVVAPPRALRMTVVWLVAWMVLIPWSQVHFVTDVHYLVAIGPAIGLLIAMVGVGEVQRRARDRLAAERGARIARWTEQARRGSATSGARRRRRRARR